MESELKGCLDRVKDLEEENCILRAKGKSFSCDLIKADDSLIRFYTGLPDSSAFVELFSFAEDSVEDLVYSRRDSNSRHKCNPSRTLSCHCELLLKLMELRLDPPYADLAQRFKVSVSTVSRIMTPWILLLDKNFKKLRAVDCWPSRYHILSSMSSSWFTLAAELVCICSMLGNWHPRLVT